MKPENKQILDKIAILNGTGATQEKANKSDFDSHLADNTKQFGTKMDKQIVDDATTKKYELGIKNGLLYYREVV